MDLVEIRSSFCLDCQAHFPGRRKKWRLLRFFFYERVVEGPLSPKMEWLTIDLIPITSKKSSAIGPIRRIILYSEEITIALGTSVSSRVTATDDSGKSREFLFLKNGAGSVYEIHAT